MSDNLQSLQVRAKAIQQVRLMNTQERPDAALIEFTTGENEKLHFLLPKAALAELAQKMIAFGEKNG